jgi:trans-aconitate methyltransferase/uncharacterized protein (DUF2062 family)
VKTRFETEADGCRRAGASDLVRRLLTERLEPGPAAAAVWVGVAFGIIPIYGLQSVVALGLATILGLNRPLTFAATFVNNPLLQPFLLAGSLQLGHLAMNGRWVSLAPAALLAGPLDQHLLALFVGSLILSAVVGGAAALAVYLFLALRSADPRMRQWRRFVNPRYRAAGWYARGFVRWKTRLDRIFGLLLTEDLGTGPAVDLGCGHGTTLALLAFRDPHRTLYGCDLDGRRIAAAAAALAEADVHLTAGDVRTFPLPPAGLITIVDVLQYLEPAEQASLLRRCADALSPEGRLLFRVPDPTDRPLSRATRLLDRVILASGGTGARPCHPPAQFYVELLTAAGLVVDVRTYRNLLPLRHTIFRARKAAGPR